MLCHWSSIFLCGQLLVALEVYEATVLVLLLDYLKGSGVAEWARALTGDRTVNGSSPAAVKTFRFASELWQFRLPRLASVFRMRH